MASRYNWMREFDTGATRDLDEHKIDLEGHISPDVLLAFGEYMHRARKLPDGSLRASDNWQLGIPKEQYLKSLIRHTFSVWSKWRKDESVDRDELCAVMFNVMGMLHEDINVK